jgi:putative flippase GtrA
LLRPNKSRDSEFVHLGRFGIIGAISVGIDYSIYSGLVFLDLNMLIAKGLSYLVGLVFGFSGNKYWTFKSKRTIGNEWKSYLLIYSLTLILNIYSNGIVYDLVSKARPEISTRAFILAFISATSLTTIINYLSIRLITFKKGIELRRESR